MMPKILIIDDEPSNQATLESFLIGEGYALHLAGSGLAGFNLARQIVPDLILLDVMMPELDGFEVCRRLRADPELSRIPIIVVTALDDEHSRIEALRSGADDFVTKPCRRDEVRARVRTVVSLNRFRIIAEQRARFQQLFELSPSAIVLADAHGRVIRVNPQAERLFATAGGRLAAGAELAACFRSGDARRVREVIVDTIAGATTSPREVKLGRGEAARALWLRGAPVPEGDQRLALLVFDDITAEVRARRDLQTLNDRLEELVQERTQELREANGLLVSYASFVSHDLRSPLAVAKGYLSMLQERVIPMTTEAAPLVAKAYSATIMMQEMIDNILNLAREENLAGRDRPPVPLDPGPIVTRVWNQLSEIHGGTDCRFVLGRLPVLDVSPIVIERVFYNLLQNALKYSVQAPQPNVEVGAVGDANQPTIFVRDNGVGFDSRDAEKLFREFVRLDTAEATEGFGIGLSLVARLVRLSGGKIWAESARGKGATFFVRFPPSVPGRRDTVRASGSDR
jgi:PAS domain S-box-containing protein